MAGSNDSELYTNNERNKINIVKFLRAKILKCDSLKDDYPK